jgi:transmembrane sensor
VSNGSQEQVEDSLPLAEAAAWSVWLAEHDLTTTLALEAWLSEDPRNQIAWERVGRVSTLIDEQRLSIELIARREVALNDVKRKYLRHDFAGRRWAAVAGLVVAVLVPLGLMLADILTPTTYATEIGERRVVVLEDGSRLSLDSGSAVTVRYTRQARDLKLERGQGRFDVARDVQRPFSVQVQDKKVVATGTAFNIDNTEHEIVVTLIEGSAAVFMNTSNLPTPIGTPASFDLKAGQQLSAVVGSPPLIRYVDLDNVSAWETGQLIFDDQPLSKVVDTVNRYSNTVQLAIDQHTADIRISGVFRTGDIPGFVDIVTSYLPVKAVDTGGKILITSVTRDGS